LPTSSKISNPGDLNLSQAKENLQKKKSEREEDNKMKEEQIKLTIQKRMNDFLEKKKVPTDERSKRYVPCGFPNTRNLLTKGIDKRRVSVNDYNHIAIKMCQDMNCPKEWIQEIAAEITRRDIQQFDEWRNGRMERDDMVLKAVDEWMRRRKSHVKVYHTYNLLSPDNRGVQEEYTTWPKRSKMNEAPYMLVVDEWKRQKTVPAGDEYREYAKSTLMDRDYEGYVEWTRNNLEELRKQLEESMKGEDQMEMEGEKNREQNLERLEIVEEEEERNEEERGRVENKENVENREEVKLRENSRSKPKKRFGERKSYQRREEVGKEEKERAKIALSSTFGDEQIKEIAGTEINNEELVEVTGKLLTKKKVFQATYNPQSGDHLYAWIRIDNQAREFKDTDIGFIENLPTVIIPLVVIERIVAQKHSFYLPFEKPLKYDKEETRKVIEKTVLKSWGYVTSTKWSAPPTRKTISVGLKQAIAIYNLPIEPKFKLKDFARALACEEEEIKTVRRLMKREGYPYVIEFYKEEKRIQYLSTSVRALVLDRMRFCHLVDFLKHARVLLFPVGQSLFANQVKEVLLRNNFRFKWIQVPAKPLSPTNRNPTRLADYAYIHFETHEDMMNALLPSQGRNVRLFPCIRTVWD